MSKAFQKLKRSLRHNSTHAKEVFIKAFVQPPLLLGCALGYWETPPEIIELNNGSKPGRVLDLGAGKGTNFITLAKAGWEAIGIENALAAVITARQKIKHAGVDAKIYFHDVTDLDFLPQDFDLVHDISCFHSLNPVERQKYRKI